MKRFLLITSLLFKMVSVFAQEDTLVDKMLIKHNQIVLCGSSFICNNRIYPFIELQNKLISNPDAFKEYKKYESDKFSDTFSGFMLFTGIIGGIATLNSKNNVSGKIMLGSLAAALLTIPFNHRSKHLNKAVELYNKQF